MSPEQQQVKDWMNKFGQETPDKPCIPSLEVRKLWAKLILEEALETINALGFAVYLKNEDNEWDNLQDCEQILTEISRLKPNLIEIADGLADLHYVAYCGTAVACGLDMEEIFKEVHRSNMSKMWTEDEVFNAYVEYEGPRGFRDAGELYYWKNLTATRTKDRLYIVRDTDGIGKVIKSPSYSPANLKPIIDKQQSNPQ